MRESRRHSSQPTPQDEEGHLLVALMILIAVMMILLTVTGQSWTFLARRDAEAELIFRGEQYANAISFYQKEIGSFPTDLKLLGQPGPHRHRFIRKLWKDPLSKDGKWGKLYLSPTGKGYINPYATRRDQQAFLAGTFGDEGPGGGGSSFGGPGRRSRGLGGGLGEEEAEEKSGYTELGAEEFELFGGEQAGMPIVGVVHKKKESGLKIYKNMANLNDWAFTILAEGQQTELGRAPSAPSPPLMRGRGVGDSSSPINVQGGRKFSPGDTNFNPATSSRNEMREKARKERERREEEERRRQEQENPRDQQPPDDEQADDSDDEEPPPDDDEDEGEEDDEETEDPDQPTQDPNAPHDPNAPQDPNAPHDPNAPPPDPNQGRRQAH